MESRKLDICVSRISYAENFIENPYWKKNASWARLGAYYDAWSRNGRH